MSPEADPRPPGQRYRYRLTFAKTEAMRFAGHLDLHRTLERTLRRARLPLAYSQGFSPHPRITLAAALPLGCTSEADLADVWLEQAMDPQEILRSLQEVQPPGLRFERAQSASEAEPSLATQVSSSEYEICWEAAVSQDFVRRTILEILARPEIPKTRRGKDYDLRPLVLAMEARAASPQGFVLWMQLAAREGATGRPDEVLEAMGLPLAGARIVRRRLLLGHQSP